MIEFKIDADNGELNITLNGTIDDLTTDLFVLIRAMYKSIRERSQIGAVIFKKSLPEMLADKTNPVWATDGDSELDNLLEALLHEDREDRPLSNICANSQIEGPFPFW